MTSSPPVATPKRDYSSMTKEELNAELLEIGKEEVALKKRKANVEFNLNLSIDLTDEI